MCPPRFPTKSLSRHRPRISLFWGKCLEGKPFRLGAQNCGVAKSGAYTGEISPVVLKELGVDFVIVGHSERQAYLQRGRLAHPVSRESALEEGLNVVFCVGEVLQDRKQGKTFKVVEGQLSVLKQQPLPSGVWKRLAIAYEPVWAIGTGENATPQQAQEVHAFIRNWIWEKFSGEEAAGSRILYGGSVKPDNSAQIMVQKDVDGFWWERRVYPTVFAGVIKNGLKSRT